MHIIIGFLTSLLTVVILVNRLSDAGFSLVSLNPFLWRRRRRWRQMYEGHPLFKINDPMEATAILVVAIAKADGDMTQDVKQLVLSLFRNEFGLSEKKATELLTASVHLLGDGVLIKQNIKKFLSVSRPGYTEAQRQSAQSLLTQVSDRSGPANDSAKELLRTIISELSL